MYQKISILIVLTSVQRGKKLGGGRLAGDALGCGRSHCDHAGDFACSLAGLSRCSPHCATGTARAPPGRPCRRGPWSRHPIGARPPTARLRPLLAGSQGPATTLGGG
ncbi:hypothetical protein niasHT_017582 [Heterodera trifolii]|uniref:Uncharacterized protein n=1 Tax=Heterodera trifolii TaxID=157864 RepID=A0ABD2KV86_9BILA